MAVLSLRLSDEDIKLIQEYAYANDMSVSSLLRETVLDRIESEFTQDDSRIEQAYRDSFGEETIGHIELWDKLGV